MSIEVDIYEKIRYLYEHEGKSQRTISKLLGVSRNTVKKYCEGSQVPWERAFYRQNEESFLEAQITGLDYFESAPKRMIFDNAKVAVKEGFGVHAKVQDKYKALAAHYAFQCDFYLTAQDTLLGRFEGDLFRKFIEKVKVQSMVEVVFLFKARAEVREILG